jgi:hypothetical protein
MSEDQSAKGMGPGVFWGGPNFFGATENLKAILSH